MTIDFKQDILAPVAQDFATMDTFINEGITSKVALVMAVSKHVVEAGGKRMRPIMCLLAAKACGAEDLAQGASFALVVAGTIRAAGSDGGSDRTLAALVI
jgi:octaprenyl-diphosphate synthase